MACLGPGFQSPGDPHCLRIPPEGSLCIDRRPVDISRLVPAPMDAVCHCHGHSHHHAPCVPGQWADNEFPSSEAVQQLPADAGRRVDVSGTGHHQDQPRVQHQPQDQWPHSRGPTAGDHRDGGHPEPGGGGGDRLAVAIHQCPELRDGRDPGGGAGHRQEPPGPRVRLPGPAGPGRVRDAAGGAAEGGVGDGRVGHCQPPPPLHRRHPQRKRGRCLRPHGADAVQDRDPVLRGQRRDHLPRLRQFVRAPGCIDGSGSEAALYTVLRPWGGPHDQPDGRGRAPRPRGL
mmetsp:Transcript_111868/g.194230  ORF Transcript_111868/g.194230 Transcript_111868/m.194230 type:complete len:287 (-) Transcript_111868:88-948(-)